MLQYIGFATSQNASIDHSEVKGETMFSAEALYAQKTLGMSDKDLEEYLADKARRTQTKQDTKKADDSSTKLLLDARDYPVLSLKTADVFSFRLGHNGAIGNYLSYAGVITIRDLCERRRDEVHHIYGIGAVSMKTINDYLKQHGLGFGRQFRN